MSVITYKASLGLGVREGYGLGMAGLGLVVRGFGLVRNDGWVSDRRPLLWKPQCFQTFRQVQRDGRFNLWLSIGLGH